MALRKYDAPPWGCIVRVLGVHRTCGEANEIKEKTRALVFILSLFLRYLRHEEPVQLVVVVVWREETAAVPRVEPCGRGWVTWDVGIRRGHEAWTPGAQHQHTKWP